MCGIVGFSGPVDEAALNAALGALAHRGPDDSGRFVDASSLIGLAHARLSILDLSPLGHQPMVDASGTFVIVFNGEIYNFRELRTELSRTGCAFRSNSDTEVLLALYEAHGQAMLPMLNGIFAFAILDTREQRLFLACDSMAVKPLYFCAQDDRFVFASELKALMPLLAERASLDVNTLYRTLGILWSPGGSTPLKGVARLGPGEAMQIKGARIERRWQWASSTWAAKTHPIPVDEAIRRVQSTFRTAVHRQMVADVPVGAFLSGGLDSSAVVAMAREISPDIACFTIDTGEAGGGQDLPYAREAAKHLGVRLHEIQVKPNRMAADLERMVVQLDEPLADPACLNVLYICELARQHGVKVLLSGAGGDDLFTGYRRHRALESERYWSWLPPLMRRGLQLASGNIGHGSTLARRVAKAFAHAGLPPDKRLAGYFLWVDPARALSLFAPEHRGAVAAHSMTKPFEEYLAALPPELPAMHRMLALEQRFFLADHNLLYTDKMSMAVGVEVRVPFLDNDLVELVNGLPVPLKQRGATGKWILKRAMEPYLPRNIIHRPKTGFGAPLRQWLRNELREWVSDTLAAETIRSRGIFDAEAVTKLVEDDRRGRIDAAYTIFGLICIEIWCRAYLDRGATNGITHG